MSVVIENVKFNRATTIPKEKKVKMMVVIYKDSSKFKIIKCCYCYWIHFATNLLLKVKVSLDVIKRNISIKSKNYVVTNIAVTSKACILEKRIYFWNGKIIDLTTNEKHVPVRFFKDINVIKTESVKIHKVRATVITRKKSINQFNCLQKVQTILANEEKENISNIHVEEGNFESGLFGFINCLEKKPGGNIFQAILIQDLKIP
ncbi:LOW QUALITY PROTEIN: fatty acid synthase-like [Vespula squamosa]|uniref:Fatty acid synthase-like n=1 Tax=Vespula squamosa TaxID=30214 RepID=A0ABD2A5H9_VESSQ